MGKRFIQASTFIFERIFVNLSGNQDRNKAPTSSNTGRIGSVTLELRALESQTNLLSTYSSKHEYL